VNQSEQVTDWVEVLNRPDYQDKLTHGLYEAIYRLGDASVDALMEGQARTCVRAFAVLAGLPAPMDLDAFLQTMRTAGPSRIEIRREGDTIYWREQHQGEWVCPLVRRSVVLVRNTPATSPTASSPLAPRAVDGPVASMGFARLQCCPQRERRRRCIPVGRSGRLLH